MAGKRMGISWHSIKVPERGTKVPCRALALRGVSACRPDELRRDGLAAVTRVKTGAGTRSCAAMRRVA